MSQWHKVLAKLTLCHSQYDQYAEGADKIMLESPCVACCRLNSEKFCVGCYRHMTEIVDWNKRSDAENSVILQKVAIRKRQAEQSLAEKAPTTAITQAEWQAARAAQLK